LASSYQLRARLLASLALLRKVSQIKIAPDEAPKSPEQQFNSNANNGGSVDRSFSGWRNYYAWISYCCRAN
jgi:hypothetical protein